MNIAKDSFANRLRDLTKILESHQLALEDKGTNMFLVGAFNLSQSDDIATQ